MGTWEPGLFSDDMALDIRSEYGILLSVGKDNETAEDMLINYYSDILDCNNPDEDVFWYALAISEWKKGRLSDRVKSKALYCLEHGCDLERWNSKGNEKNYKKRKKVLEELRETILSPMPEAKKIRKPRVRHCPWKEGSLLAYRIVTNKDKLSGHPCFNKYVLLRVARVYKRPVSKLFETEYYDESMLIGLYNWMGSEIPSPEIVDNLKYIPISEYIPPKPVNPIDLTPLDSLSAESQEKVKNAVFSFFKNSTDWFNWFVWFPKEGDITFLNCDENYLEKMPQELRDKLGSSVYTSYLPFDIDLSLRFEPYLKNNDDFDCLII
ncbi:MAG: hypothetical protein IKV52_05345 [Oscillospiraceae bacterium]|nr:hypothetical protein [Oscillospiraceae bacterium]